MNEIKYHRDVFFPKESIKDIADYLSVLPETFKKSYHVQNERWWKHDYDISKRNLYPKDIFELAYKDGKLCKIGFRVTDIDTENDVIFIISIQGIIVTSWLNKKSDTHRTLDTNKYHTKWFGRK
jgi:hypothetical protein